MCKFQVALEEKRLINALKNGDVVNDEPIITQIPSKHIIREPEKAFEGTTKWGLRSASKRPEQQVGYLFSLPYLSFWLRDVWLPQVPHPELTSSQRQHLRQTAANPVRPFLTRGSVAERVLIFERCPSDLLLDKRVRAPVPQASKPQVGGYQVCGMWIFLQLVRVWIVELLQSLHAGGADGLNRHTNYLVNK